MKKRGKYVLGRMQVQRGFSTCECTSFLRAYDTICLCLFVVSFWLMDRTHTMFRSTIKKIQIKWLGGSGRERKRERKRERERSSGFLKCHINQHIRGMYCREATVCVSQMSPGYCTVGKQQYVSHKWAQPQELRGFNFQPPPCLFLSSLSLSL